MEHPEIAALRTSKTELCSLFSFAEKNSVSTVKNIANC